MLQQLHRKGALTQTMFAVRQRLCLWTPFKEEASALPLENPLTGKGHFRPLATLNTKGRACPFRIPAQPFAGWIRGATP
jgi:hypothetical protein